MKSPWNQSIESGTKYLDRLEPYNMIYFIITSKSYVFVTKKNEKTADLFCSFWGFNSGNDIIVELHGTI